jgi:hypothetical protein
MAKPKPIVRLVTEKDDTNPRLVRATSKAQALAHVVRNTFSTRIPTQDELIALAKAGVEVEEVNSEEQE